MYLEHSPSSEALLLPEQAQAISTPDELKRRWQVVLTYHGGSPQLWRQYLHWQRAQYANFAVQQVTQSYQNAVQVQTSYKHTLFLYPSACAVRSTEHTLAKLSVVLP